MLGERGDQRPDAARSPRSAARWRPRSRPATPGSAGSSGTPAVERDLDRLRAQVAQLGQRALVDEPAGAQDPDPVADRLDLAQDVRGEEDRLPALLRLAHRLAERHLHQRVEAARSARRGSAGRRGSRSAATSCTFWRLPFESARTFLSVSSWKRSTSIVAVGRVGAAAHAGEELERLGAGERRPQERLARDVGDAPVGRDGVAPGVDAEELGAARARAVQAEQEPDRRRLARAVRPQVAVDLAALDAQVELLDRPVSP